MTENAKNRLWIKKLLTGNEGFSLLEMIMVLLVMSVLAGVMAPLAFKFMDDTRETATRKEMEAIHLAIMGNQVFGDYGYVGDMGELPSVFADLNTKPAGADDYRSDTRVNGVGIGWNGPYLNIGYSANDYLKDAWNRDYTYNNGTGQITSLGSDGALSTNDDIVIPPYTADTSGAVSVTVNIYDPPGGVVAVDDSCAGVTVYYSASGTEDSNIATYDTPRQVFESTGLHQGVHAVQVTGTGVDCGGYSAKANATVFKGTTSLTIFLGTIDLP